MTSLAGRTTLITGATGRLGRAIAEAYCGAGAAVTLSALDGAGLRTLAAELSTRHGVDVAAIPCDLRRADDIDALLTRIQQTHGGLDVLINAAAVMGPIGAAWELPWDDWHDTIDINLLGVVRLCQLAVPLMPRGRGRGKIINLSGGGATSARPRFSAYATAKTGVVRFTETLAQELADRPIDANCIAPGVLNSRLTRAVVDAGVERAGRREYETAAAMIASDTDNAPRAAALALFLGSSVSDGITGRLLSAVWDDWAALRADSPALHDPQTYTLRRVVPEPSPGAPAAATVVSPLTVCVAGLWHLGCVTAACLGAAGHRVVAYDTDPAVVARLRDSKLPVAEAGLQELLVRAVQSERLVFASTEAVAAGADVLWATWDTPIDESDRPDVAWVLDRIAQLFPHLRDDAIVVVSSQLPAGSVAELERRFAARWPGRSVSFACIPENLRLGSAIESFMHREHVVVGIRHDGQRQRLSALLAPFTRHIEWMRVESAEMTKHALNAFLATSVAFINEIATVCEDVGADAAEVSRGLRLDRRVGRDAYLSPGAAFSGGTLARDVVALTDLAARSSHTLHVLGAVKPSNDHHRRWAVTRLERELGALEGRTIGVWGLTYKPGTDTLRRSGAVELCRALVAAGATVRAYDPAIPTLPAALGDGITLAGSAVAAARGADALVVATEWSEFLSVRAEDLAANGRALVVLDANGFLADTLGHGAGIRYLGVGRP